MGRKLKLNKEMIKEIVKHIKLGISLKGMCRCVGISFNAYDVWMKKGNASNSGIYKELYDAVQEAHGKLESRLVIQYMKKAPENCKDILAFLKTRFPEEYDRPNKIELSGDKDNPVQVNVNDEDDLQRKILEAGPEAVREFKEFVRKLGLTGNEE